MKIRFRIGRFLLLGLLVCPLLAKAQQKTDSVVMTVGGKEVSLAEFKYMAAKNNEVDFADVKSLNSYVELFKNFKLKVADAEDAGLDKTSGFMSEFNRYKAELTASYMSDEKGQDAVVQKIYRRGDQVLDLSYILFRFSGRVVSKDTARIYQDAYEVYQRIQHGENFDAVVQSVTSGENASEQVFQEYVNSLTPLKASKAFDDVAYALEEGEVSAPVLTPSGYYIIKLHKRKPNLGLIAVEHILLRVEDNNPDNEKAVLERIRQIRQQAVNGEDFSELAKEFSEDAGSAKRGGALSLFGQGAVVAPFEEVAFNLPEIGAISEPVRTIYGYHIIKLTDKRPRPTFDKEKEAIASVLKKGEWNFDYYDSFDSRLKKEYNYTFYPEKYAELQNVCDEYFPADSMFFKTVLSMEDTLLVVNNHALTQKDFSRYLYRHPYSTKTYSVDFMREVYDLFTRDVMTSFERENLETKYPEYNHLLQEYRDGILLFEVSKARVWEHPTEDQPRLEREWMKELKNKYPVTVNTKLLKKIKKH